MSVDVSTLHTIRKNVIENFNFCTRQKCTRGPTSKLIRMENPHREFSKCPGQMAPLALYKISDKILDSRHFCLKMSYEYPKCPVKNSQNTGSVDCSKCILSGIMLKHTQTEVKCHAVHIADPLKNMAVCRHQN